MTTARIDVAFRVGPTTDTIKVCYPTGGVLVDVTLTHGLYLTADALATEINARLQAYSVNLFCFWDAPTRTYTFRTDLLNFDIQITYPTLREFLGVALSTKYTNVSDVVGTTPGVFLSSMPWHGDTLTLCRSRKAGARPHNRANHVPLAAWYEFGVTAMLKAPDELALFRVVMGYALRGIPITVYYDASVLTAWSSTNWWGRRTCVLTPEAATYVDSWLTQPHQALAEVQLELREYTASEATAATFAGAIGHTEVGVRFYAKIGGIGDIYLDGETPVGPAGATWSTPTSKTVASYTYRPHMLDVGAGIKDLGAEISRRAGSTTPGSLTLTLADSRAHYLRGLFARDLATGHTAQLTATLAYDTAGAGATIQVDSTTGWASVGPAYLGRETVYYDGKTGTTLDATVAGGGARDVYSLGSDDVTYRHNPNKVIPSPRIISDNPITWHGRHVRVFAFLVDHAGRAYDSAIDSTSGYTREVYRGIVQGDPYADSTWRSWRVETKSIDVILQTEIGQEPVTGQLMQVPGNAAANNAGIAETVPIDPAQYYTYFLTNSNNKLHMTVTEYVNAAAYAADTVTSTTTYPLTVAGAGTLLTVTGIQTAIRTAMGNVFGAAPAGTPMGDYADLSCLFSLGTEKIRFTFWSAGVKVHRIEMNFSATGSIGPLIEFAGTHVDVAVGGASPQDPAIISTQAAEFPPSVHIGAADTEIPFWYTETAGIQPDGAAASGYARIGEEIVYYASVGPYTSVDGMYALSGCLRGRMGTTPTEHVAKLGVDHTAQGEAVKVTFGIGFEDVGFLTAVLRLATSTGGGHHGTYDTLAAKVGPGLCVKHFDTVAIAKIEAALPPGWRSVSCFISKPIKLSELLSGWLAPLGLYLTARTGATGLYRITVDEVVPPLESEASTVTLGTGQLDARQPAEWRSGNDLIINRIKASGYVWDILKDAPKEGADVIAVDEDSEYDYGVRGSLDWTLRGYHWSVAEAITNVHPVVARTFARYGRPYDVLTLKTDRTGWLLRPGDHVPLTVPEAPDPDGTGGISSRLAVVLKVAPTYWDPGGELGAEVTVIVERYVRQSTYSPSARVASTNAGVPSITLTAVTYTDTEHTDAEWFDNGDVVKIWNLGDNTTADIRTLSGKSGNTFTISAALVNCTVGANTRMVATTYAAVQAEQRKHAFLASNAAPPVLTVATALAFRYI